MSDDFLGHLVLLIVGEGVVVIVVGVTIVIVWGCVRVIVSKGGW